MPANVSCGVGRYRSGIPPTLQATKGLREPTTVRQRKTGEITTRLTPTGGQKIAGRNALVCSVVSMVRFASMYDILERRNKNAYRKPSFVMKVPNLLNYTVA